MSLVETFIRLHVAPVFELFGLPEGWLRLLDPLLIHVSRQFRFQWRLQLRRLSRNLLLALVASYIHSRVMSGAYGDLFTH